jgi:hypothetical protein
MIVCRLVTVHHPDATALPGEHFEKILAPPA